MVKQSGTISLVEREALVKTDINTVENVHLAQVSDILPSV